MCILAVDPAQAVAVIVEIGAGFVFEEVIAEFDKGLVEVLAGAVDKVLAQGEAGLLRNGIIGHQISKIGEGRHGDHIFLEIAIGLAAIAAEGLVTVLDVIQMIDIQPGEAIFRGQHGSLLALARFFQIAVFRMQIRFIFKEAGDQGIIVQKLIGTAAVGPQNKSDVKFFVFFVFSLSFVFSEVLQSKIHRLFGGKKILSKPRLQTTRILVNEIYLCLPKDIYLRGFLCVFCAFFVHFFKLIWAQKNGSVKLIYLTTCPARNVAF